MREITLDELIQITDAQWRDPALPAVAVLLGSTECPHCSAFRALLGAVEGELGRRNVDMVYVEVDERPPLFAPNALPSMVCFYRGVRLWEGIGQVDNPELVKAALLFHVHGEVHAVE